MIFKIGVIVFEETCIITLKKMKFEKKNPEKSKLQFKEKFIQTGLQALEKRNFKIMAIFYCCVKCYFLSFRNTCLKWSYLKSSVLVIIIILAITNFKILWLFILVMDPYADRYFSVKHFP